MANRRGQEPSGFVVSVLTGGGQPAGAGFLVSPTEVMTCAHVVNAALGRDPHSQDVPDLTVRLSFPLLPGTPVLGARVDRWLAPPRTGAAGDDIACLRLADPVPAQAAPARLATTPQRIGQIVDVFGYPETPRRPYGSWVEAYLRGPVAGGRLQLDSTPGAALRIQPGYSGSPVCERESGQVVGMLAAAPQAAAALRDAYAIGVGQLLSAWPEALDPQGTVKRRLTGQRVSESEVTVLHLSDPQFLPGDHPDQAALFRPLHEDLEELADGYGVRPDLVVVTGDLTAHGMPSEFRRAVRFLSELTGAAGLPRRHVALIPGNHDVNRAACAAYFGKQQSLEQEPTRPYWPKWDNFTKLAFDEFYADVPGASFTPDEPWSLFEMPDLRVAVAGLNSTMAESHQDGDHYGLVGEAQVRWFADRLADYQRQGWLRLVAVHHSVLGGVRSGRYLRDRGTVDQLIGQPSLASLLLQSLSNDARMQQLPSGLAVLSIGRPAVNVDGGLLQYQVISVQPDCVTRYPRIWAPDRGRWVGEASGAGRETFAEPLSYVQQAFRGSEEPPEKPKAWGTGPRGVIRSEDVLLYRVAEATRARYPDARITSTPGAGYLRVSAPVPGVGVLQWPVGVIEVPTEQIVRDFIDGTHAKFAAADPQLRSDLVYARGLPNEQVITLARHCGVRLRSLVDYQGLIDLRPLVAAQEKRIAADHRYPEALYVPQRFRDLAASQGEVQEGLLDQVIGWLDGDGPRFVTVLGDSGRGKTFLLRQLARRLPERLPAMLPVVIDLHGLEKGPSLDELLAQYLVRQGMQTVELVKLRYMVESGRLALLFDGFDELALRVSYDHAADYLQTFLGAATDQAKIVLTSRRQHFQSADQVRTALGERVLTTAGSRIAVIEDFTDEQIRQFLVNHYAGDEEAARARFNLLDQVQDLLGLSHNPRMLSFIADLDEGRLREIEQQRGAISAAGLYREIIDNWLRIEAQRQAYRIGLPSLDQGERFQACQALALRLWASAMPTIPLSDLSIEVAAALQGLAEHGYSADEAAQAVGSGTLLVSTADGAFTFVHPSVMEWLVADGAASRLRAGDPAGMLLSRRLSRLMADFLCDLAGLQPVSDWATSILEENRASEVAKQNALDLRARLARTPGQRGRAHSPSAELANTDLRGQDLTVFDLRAAKLTGANLRGMRLKRTNFADANLRAADFTGARLVGCHLEGADVSDSHWSSAALIGVTGLDRVFGASALVPAGVVGRDPVQAMLTSAGVSASVAVSPTERVLAVSRGYTVEIADLETGRSLRVITGHDRDVTGVAFSPDGTLIATASADKTARIWEVATGRLAHTFTGHGDRLGDVAFSPDGALIATASADKTARTWDVATGQPLHTYEGHTERLYGVTFSPDGALIATASADKTARTWDVATGQPRDTFKGHTDELNDVAFSPDGTLIVTASDDSTARTWETATGQPRTTLAGHDASVYGVAFSPDGTMVATASSDSTARTWDVATGQPRAILPGSEDQVSAVAFSPDGTVIATASYDGTARTWDTTTGQPRATVSRHDDYVTGVAFSPSGTMIVTTYHDGTARTWDTATGQPRATLAGHADELNRAVFSPDGTLIVTASDDKTARVWDAATGQPRATLIGHTGFVIDVAFSPDGTRIATASYDGTARIWDAATIRPGLVMSHPAASRASRALAAITRRGRSGHGPDPVTRVGFSPDGTLIATTSPLYLWPARGGEPRFISDAGHARLTGLAFSPDGTLIAAASTDLTARIWNVATGLPRHTFRGHTSMLNDVTFSPDGTLIATASDDKTARVWDIASGRTRVILTGHDSWVAQVVFSPDGRLIATASGDGTFRIWDADGNCLATLRAFGQAGYAVLRPDGSYKLEGNSRGELWWAVKLARFEPGEVDEFVPAVHRLPADLPIIGHDRP